MLCIFRPYLQVVLPVVYLPYCTAIIFVQGFLKRFQSNAFLMLDSFLTRKSLDISIAH